MGYGLRRGDGAAGTAARPGTGAPATPNAIRCHLLNGKGPSWVECHATTRACPYGGRHRLFASKRALDQYNELVLSQDEETGFTLNDLPMNAKKVLIVAARDPSPIRQYDPRAWQALMESVNEAKAAREEQARSAGRTLRKSPSSLTGHIDRRTVQSIVGVARRITEMYKEGERHGNGTPVNGDRRMNAQDLNDLRKRVERYIRTDTGPDMKALKRHLGADVIGDDESIARITDIIVRPPTAMYGRLPIEDMPARALMSRIDNNMTRINTTFTILYCGGRCCYCGKVLRRSEGEENRRDDEATADHIDPISPYDGAARRGRTRFGNVALCCFRCNRAKNNASAGPWLEGDTTDSGIRQDPENPLPDGNGLTPERRMAAMRIIGGLREAAGYQPLAAEQSERAARISVWLRPKHDSNARYAERNGYDEWTERDKREYMDDLLDGAEYVKGTGPDPTEDDTPSGREQRRLDRRLRNSRRRRAR